ncbi:MAG: GGDEF domain-containing protein [Ruminococcaceae bacterium]|nr:GGDEF domain-containing protein [Oscillospiraceae bacterium]
MKKALVKFNELGFLALSVFIIFSLFSFTSAFDMPDINLMDNEVRSFSKGWIRDADGYIIEFNTPFHLEVKENESLVIKNTIPDNINPGDVVAFKAYMQSVVVKIDGDTVYDIGTEYSNYLGRDFGSFWVFVDTVPENVGKEIEITLFSHKPAYRGYAPEIFTGNRAAMLNHIYSQKGLWIILPFAITIAGALIIVLSFISALHNGINKAFFYLGTYIFIMGSWLLGESGILQIISHNTYYVTRAPLLAILISPVAINLYIKETVPMKNRFSANIIATLSVINAAVNLGLEFFNVSGITDSLVISLALIAITCVYYILVFLVEAIAYKNEHARREFFATAVFFVFIFIEIGAFYITGQKETSYFMLIGLSIFSVLMITYRVRDYRARVRQMEESEYFEKMAYTDALTGAKNRARFIDDINCITEPEGVVIVQADTDRLKHINDNFGHSFGDQAIMNTYEVLSKHFEQLGDVYRVGGDEFTVIVKNADEDNIIEIIGAVRREMELINIRCEYDFSISLGFAKYDASLDKDIYSTAIRADQEMYDDKKRLRGTVFQTKIPVMFT